MIDEYKNVTSGDTFPERIFMNEINNSFDQVVEIINHARENAFRKVNEELILMYQAVGRFLSERAKEASYGDNYVDSLLLYHKVVSNAHKY